jgi:hypothetical protein
MLSRASAVGSISRASGRIAPAYGTLQVGARKAVDSVYASLSAEAAQLAAARAGGRKMRVVPPETPLQRLGRLQQEAAELEAELAELEHSAGSSGRRADVKASKGDALDRASEGLAALRHLLEGLAGRTAHMSSEGIQGPSSLMDAVIKLGEMSLPSSDEAEPTPAGGAVDEDVLGSLELRVAEMERLLGADSAEPDARGLSLRVSQLEEKLASLDAEGMHLLSGRAALAAVELRAARLEAEATPHSSTDAASLANALGALERVEEAADAIPVIVARLESLAHLHLRASGAVEAMEILSETQQVTKGSIDAAISALHSVREALVSAGKDWNSSIEAVNARLDELEK